MASCDEAAHLFTHEDDFLISVIIQATRENQILYTNNFQMKNRV